MSLKIQKQSHRDNYHKYIIVRRIVSVHFVKTKKLIYRVMMSGILKTVESENRQFKISNLKSTLMVHSKYDFLWLSDSYCESHNLIIVFSVKFEKLFNCFLNQSWKSILEHQHNY